MDGTKKRTTEERTNRGFIPQERDLNGLREIAIMRVADASQVKIAAGFGSTTRVNARLLGLTQAGLLRRFFLGSGGGRKALYALSPKGAALIRVSCRGPRRRQDAMLVADFFIQHQLSINTVYCDVKFRTIEIPGVTFRAWRTLHEPIVSNISLIPDGYVEFSTPLGIDGSFIEVDLGHESLAIWKEKADNYKKLALSDEYQRQFQQDHSRVLVLADSERRLNSIRATVAGVTTKMFWFATLDAIRGDRFFDPVWLRPIGKHYQPFFKEPQ
jgi:hypothetical protein